MLSRQNDNISDNIYLTIEKSAFIEFMCAQQGLSWTQVKEAA